MGITVVAVATVAVVKNVVVAPPIVEAPVVVVVVPPYAFAVDVLVGPGVEAAAQEEGVPDRTFRRWQEHRMQQNILILRKTMTKAVTTSGDRLVLNAQSRLECRGLPLKESRNNRQKNHHSALHRRMR
jgi:hypothetical protein